MAHEPKSIHTLLSFLNPGGTLDSGEWSLHDHARLDEVRDALRIWIRSGAAPDPAAVESINRAGSAVLLRVVIDHAGTTRVESVSSSPVDSTLGAVLAAVYEVVRSGLWGRLRMCANPSCGWVFFDRSRNHSKVWCEMAECGNRAKARRYRAKRKGARA